MIEVNKTNMTDEWWSRYKEALECFIEDKNVIDRIISDSKCSIENRTGDDLVDFFFLSVFVVYKININPLGLVKGYTKLLGLVKEIVKDYKSFLDALRIMFDASVRSIFENYDDIVEDCKDFITFGSVVWVLHEMPTYGIEVCFYIDTEQDINISLRSEKEFYAIKNLLGAHKNAE